LGRAVQVNIKGVDTVDVNHNINFLTQHVHLNVGLEVIIKENFIEGIQFVKVEFRITVESILVTDEDTLAVEGGNLTIMEDLDYSLLVCIVMSSRVFPQVCPYN
jgi:hypothetical protein